MRNLDETLYRIRRGLRGLGHELAEYLWPTRCVCCERLGALLCRQCLDELPCIDISKACPRCGAPFGRTVCTECTPIYQPISFSFSHSLSALEFNEQTRRLIISYKDGNERRLAPLIAQLMIQIVPLEWRIWADMLTWIPADGDAYRRRGFDHMSLVAQSMGEQSGLVAYPLLVKRRGKDQRSLSRTQRQVNADEIFSPSDCSSAGFRDRGSNILLVDDVFTTGSTLEAASRTLLACGATEIRAITLCRVW